MQIVFSVNVLRDATAYSKMRIYGEMIYWFYSVCRVFSFYRRLYERVIALIHCRFKERSRGSGGGGTCRDTWALTPNTNIRLLAAATTSALRSPCWLDAARKHAETHPPVTMTCLAYDSHKLWYRRTRCTKTLSCQTLGGKITVYVSSGIKKKITLR